jgi:hypothetical protein
MRNAREQIIPSVVSVGLNLKSFYIFHWKSYYFRTIDIYSSISIFWGVEIII